MNINDINDYIPSLLNPRAVKKDRGDFTLTQNSVASRCSLSLRRSNGPLKQNNIRIVKDKENVLNNQNCALKTPQSKNTVQNSKNVVDDGSIGFSAIDDLSTIHIDTALSPLNFVNEDVSNVECNCVRLVKDNESLISVSSATDLNDRKSDETVVYEIDKPTVSVSLGITNCSKVDISTNKTSLKRVLVCTQNNNTTVDCEVIEESQLSTESNLDENMNESILPNPLKKSAVAVNLQIKRKKLSDDNAEDSKVLILNTDAIEKLSHVIVQPPNYKLVKRQTLIRNTPNKIKGSVTRKSIASPRKNGKVCDNLKQRTIEDYLSGKAKVKVSNARTEVGVNSDSDAIVTRNVYQDMSKNSDVPAVIKCEHSGRESQKSPNNDIPRLAKLSPKRRGAISPKHQDIKISASDAPRLPTPRSRNNSISSHSPRKNIESIQFNLPAKSKLSKTPNVYARHIPHHKIVAGTHFAVDAFSYGEIPNVTHYFLTHFHSDHYSGLKKGFNKLLFCSKITADLCISRLGVNPKCIHVINPDESLQVEDVEVTALDANHCPGALMLVFTLLNGKSLLHTGDFRATSIMESHPIFWNKDIHTVYLDTTYCNPRYDFPTQDQSLEMALYLLRQKKFQLEKAGKKFSSVLIVCGTYTIGKEKFFLGMAGRVGCSVWACPEKDRVLQAVEGRSFSQAPPQSCQLHVVPMRDLTHEKLRCYLDNLQGAFDEVVAFKPSGWENCKNSSVERDMVTIHGIPYSEHSSFSEMIRFIKFLKPKQVIPTVDISGGIKAVQKHFPCPLVYKEDIHCQSKVTDYFSIQNRQQVSAVT